jgi:hypothetical protein
MSSLECKFPFSEGQDFLCPVVTGREGVHHQERQRRNAVSRPGSSDSSWSLESLPSSPL